MAKQLGPKAAASLAECVARGMVPATTHKARLAQLADVAAADTKEAAKKADVGASGVVGRTKLESVRLVLATIVAAAIKTGEAVSVPAGHAVWQGTKFATAPVVNTDNVRAYVRDIVAGSDIVPAGMRLSVKAPADELVGLSKAERRVARKFSRVLFVLEPERLHEPRKF